MYVFARLILIALFALPSAVAAQTPQSQAVEDWETPTDTGGAETELDAADAQVQAIEQGEPTGLSRRASNQVEEIVVSARRRDELLEDTPVSVTAFGEAALRESNITQMTNLNGVVPNLQFQAGGGNPNLAQVFIRGVGQVDSDQLSADPGVGVYVDGVYLARSQGTVLDVVDVAQLEVLRGPQGTLFGKNTAGGALNITSVKPSEEFEGFVLLRPGNLGQIDTRVTLNVPILEDRIFSRVTFASFMNEGYMFNGFKDEYWSNRNSLAFQGSLRILPHDDVTIDITGNYSKAHSKQFGAHCTMFKETGLQDLIPGFREACKKSGTLTTRRFDADWPGMADLQSYGIWGTIQWDIGDASVFEDLSLKSITAFRAQEEAFSRDMDMTSINMGSQTSTGESVTFGGVTMPTSPLFASQISQEFQLNGTAWDGKINYVGGVYYLTDSADKVTATGFVPDQPSLGGVFYADTRIDNSSFAVFGQATAEILDWMSLTGGLRWTREDKEAHLFDNEPAVRVRADATDSKEFTAWTPMATLAMRLPEQHMPELLDHFMGYFTFAKGFKSGGFNLRPIPNEIETLEPYEPENLNSFEIGFKTIAWDRKLTFNTSFFLSDYDNIQVLTVTTVDTGGFIPTVVPLTQNAATATVKGAEFELLLMPFDGFRIQANGALLDSEFGDYEGVSDLTGEPISRKGETFSNVPPYSAFLAAQYSFEVLDGVTADWLRGWLSPRVEGVMTGPIHYQGPELPTATQGAFGLLNARLAYDFNDDRSQVALWGRNLTDTTYFNSSIPITAFGFNLPFLGAPRTFGAELTHRF